MDPRPNILLITADQMRWDAVCGRSIGRSPNLNRLADGGMRFERSYTPCPLCCPARAMLLTGAYPWHNGVYHQVHVPMSLNPDLAPDVQTYPQRLREAGYRLAYVGKWHASRTRGPYDFGYHTMRAPAEFSVTPACRARHGMVGEPIVQRDTSLPYQFADTRHVTWPGGDRFPMWTAVEGVMEATQEYFLARRTAETIHEFAAGSEPWLIECHIPAPHDPYKPLRRFLDGYRLGDVPLPDNYVRETFEGKPGLLSREASLWAELTDEDIRDALRHYYAFCEQVDHAVGIILDGLDESGRAGETLVVFASDHGDNVGSHRTFIKGWTPYEETHRIPMIARWPGRIPAGSATGALVQLHDWAHTFVSLAGAPALPHADGRDLTPLLAEPHRAEESWPAHILNVYYGCEFLYVQRIAIGRRFKYVFNSFDWDELYDLQADPGELRNLAKDPAHAETAQDMRDALWELCYRHHDPYTQMRWGMARYLGGPRGGRQEEPWLDVYYKTPNHPFVTRLSRNWPEPPAGREDGR